MSSPNLDFYKNILVSVDNSDHSRCAERLGLMIGKASQAKITGLHVYSGTFHRFRFDALEEHLPDKYLREAVLDYQRKIHSVLINRGLELISLEYMKHLRDACQQADVFFEERLVDGKNSDSIIEQAESCDLVVMGALGIGAVPGGSKLGSNARRILHDVQKDVCITRKECELKNIFVGVDGSDYSFRTVERSAQLAKAFNSTLTILTCFDPVLHKVVFRSLADVLSEQSGRVFKFKEQELLHNQVIDSSLEKLYQGYLEKARHIALGYHVSVKTELLKGKPYAALCERLMESNADLFVVGRFGMHKGKHSRIGSTAERVAENAQTNVLLVSLNNGVQKPSVNTESRIITETAHKTLVWNEDAKKRLENIPNFARPMAVLAIERYATEKGITVITPDVMKDARGRYES